MGSGYDQSYTERCLLFIERYFDRVELGVCFEWAEVNEGNLTTELRAANLVMNNEKNKYLTVYESMPNPVILLDENNQMEVMNHAAAQLAMESSTPGSSYYSGRHNIELLAWLDEELVAFFHDEKANDLSFVKRFFLSGVDRYFDVKMKRMLDVSGKFNGTVIILNDITGRKQIENKLEKERNFSNAVIETAGALVVVLNPQGRIERFNRACERTIGYTFAEVRGEFIWDLLLVSEEAERVKAVFGKLKAGQFPSQVENFWKTRDGDRRLIAWSNTVLLEDEGSVMYIIGTGIDITESRKAEEALGKSNEELIAVNEELTATNEELVATEEELKQQLLELAQSREALAALNKQLQDIIEFLPDATFVVDKNKRIIAWNKSIEEMTGVTKEEIIGKGDYAYALPFYGQPRPMLVDIVFSSDKELERQYLNFRRKGSIYYGETHAPNIFGGRGAFIWIKASPLFDGKGRIAGAIECIRDVTDLRLAREQLFQEKERLSVTLSSIGDGVIAVDTGGRVTLINPVAETLTGYHQADAMGRPMGEIFNIISEQTRQPAKNPVQRVFEEGIIVGLANHTALITRDGTERSIADSAAPIRDSDGQMLGAILVFRDVTEERYLEKALFEEKERLAVTLRSIGEGVITTDTEGMVILINRVAEKLTGWPQEEAAGKSLAEVFNVINEVTRESCGNLVEKAISSRGIVEPTGNVVLVAGDGTERSVAKSIAPIFSHKSSIIGVVLVFRDVTELRKMEQEVLRANKLESLSILAGGIAHDFNNILTAVIGNISLARMYGINSVETLAVLDEIEQASQRARDLTQQLLTFAKGGLPVKKTASIAELIKETSSFVLRGSNVKCRYHIPGDLWPVEIDRGQISQVINNLIINAQQAMPEGGTIRINCENETMGAERHLPLSEGDYIKITINDTGMGIPGEYQQRIFDPYFTTKQKGSGLGLAISYSIINKHGGHISVKSELGNGATFFIYLPASQYQVSPASEKQKALTGHGKVLVMDDEEMVVKVAGKMLKHIGYEVEIAGDGVDALRLYQEARMKGRPFDAVIMDLTVPGGMGGREAISKLLEIDPDVKAIVSSGYSNDPVMANFRDYGFRGVVVKPFKIEELSNTLYNVLSNT
jgi:PAS domain S-box-containing protein